MFMHTFPILHSWLLHKLQHTAAPNSGSTEMDFLKQE